MVREALIPVRGRKPRYAPTPARIIMTVREALIPVRGRKPTKSQFATAFTTTSQRGFNPRKGSETQGILQIYLEKSGLSERL